MVVARVWGLMKMDMLVRVQTFSYARSISSGELMNSQVTIVNNTVLYTLKFAKRIFFFFFLI